jgi:hypothetical protein
MQRGLLVVFTSPTSKDDDDEFNRWYDESHVKEMLQVAGFTAATRYRAADMGSPPAMPATPYLALYEVEAESLLAAQGALTAATPTFPQSPTLQRNPGPVLMWFEELTPRRTA